MRYRSLTPTSVQAILPQAEHTSGTTRSRCCRSATGCITQLSATLGAPSRTPRTLSAVSSPAALAVIPPPSTMPRHGRPSASTYTTPASSPPTTWPCCFSRPPMPGHRRTPTNGSCHTHVRTAWLLESRRRYRSTSTLVRWRAPMQTVIWYSTRETMR